MIVKFNTDKLREICETLGSLLSMAVGRIHALKGDRYSQYAMDLDAGRRLVFEPAAPFLRRSDGTCDTRSVTGITVVFIGDYHA